MYGDPARRVWVRKSDGKIWEADDGDHAGGGSGCPRTSGGGGSDLGIDAQD